MNRVNTTIILAVLCCSVAAPCAVAWSPKTEVTLVDFALNLMSKQGNFPLKPKQEVIREGASTPTDQILQQYPALATDPARAIDAEMNILQAAGQAGFDTYFAYRLGVLGKMVTMTTTPLRDVSAMFRDRYETDVEGNIDRLAIQTSARAVVDARSYFPELAARTAARDTLILKDYQDGVGFGGVAKTSLPTDAGRTVDAVADVWFTLLTAKTQTVAVSEDQLRQYALGAYAFYIARRNPAEIDAASARLDKLVSPTPDMRVRLGDYYYEAKLYERAMAEYQRAREADPARRDVVEKISAYYVEEGDRFLEDGALEKALKAYMAALDANALHPTAQAKRLEAERLIAERDARQDEQLNALNEAAGLEAQADQHAISGFYAAAIAQLAEANKAYETINNEFPEIYAKATRGIRDNQNRIRELRDGLIANAQQFSGSGFGDDVRDLARLGAQQLDNDTLQSLCRRALRDQMKRIVAETNMETLLNGAPQATE